MKYRFSLVALVAIFMIFAYGAAITASAGDSNCVPNPNCCADGKMKSAECKPGTTGKAADCCPSGKAKADSKTECQPKPGCCENGKTSSNSKASMGKSDCCSKKDLAKKSNSGS